MTRNRGDTDYNNNNNNYNEHNNKFERKLSRLFDDFLNDVGFTRTHGSKFRGGDGGKNINWSPAIDIKEVDREYLVIADVPGVRKEDIDIEFHDSVLVLSGHLNQQDIYSTPQAQEINVGKDNHHLPQQPQYPQQQYQQQQPQQFQQQYQQQPQYQQSTEPNQYQQHQQPQQQQPQQQQPPPQPPPRQQPQQPQQQSTEPHQQPTEAQQYQQSVDQKYNLSNEHQQPQQQSNEYQHVKHRHQNETSRGERFHIQERPYGHFSRSIQLPSNIKSDDEFMATLENGILKIRIPKNNDKPRRKITIK